MIKTKEFLKYLPEKDKKIEELMNELLTLISEYKEEKKFNKKKECYGNLKQFLLKNIALDQTGEFKEGLINWFNISKEYIDEPSGADKIASFLVVEKE